MKHAREDLGANVFGKFSPEDWDAILSEANRRLDGYLAHEPPVTPELAWRRVMVEFGKENHWGFSPTYRRPRVKRTPNLGLRLIWMVFITFTGVKIGLAWLGQKWTRSGEAGDKYLFLSVIALTLANTALFLWRSRHHRD